MKGKQKTMQDNAQYTGYQEKQFEEFAQIRQQILDLNKKIGFDITDRTYTCLGGGLTLESFKNSIRNNEDRIRNIRSSYRKCLRFYNKEMGIFKERTSVESFLVSRRYKVKKICKKVIITIIVLCTLAHFNYINTQKISLDLQTIMSKISVCNQNSINHARGK